MNRSKTTVEEIIGILDNRLQDISSLNRQNTQRNTMTVIESINDKENQRLRQMGKLELMVNQFLRQESNEVLTQIGKYLHESTMKIFNKMHFNFRIEPIIRYQNIKFISLFRRYFIQINDIRMMAKLDDMFKNKALKKPAVITKLLKLLADIVRENLYDTLRVANTNVSQNQIEEYYKYKRETLKQITLDGIIESKIGRNILAIRPIFMIQSFSRAQQTIADETKLGNLKKLKQKWKQRLSKKQNEREINLIDTQNKRTYSGTATPITDSLLICNGLKQNIEDKVVISSFPQKSQSAPMIQKTTFAIKFRRSQDKIIPIRNDHRRSTKTGFKDYSGVGDFREMYNPLNLEEKFISKTFLKKSRRYYPETELKLRLDRNSEVIKQIESYKKRG